MANSNRRKYSSKSEERENSRTKKGRNKNSDRNYGKDRIDQRNTPSNELLNDPDFYFTSSELAQQTSQLSFQSVLGFGDNYGAVVPTIARVDMAMCPGVTEKTAEVESSPFGVGYGYSTHHIPKVLDGKAGVNLMAAKLYTTLSSFTGRTASYAPQDVAMMILAISGVAEWSETIRRAFGLALTYNYRNRTMPIGVLHSMGLDTTDFIANLSVYRMRFNVALSRINQIPLLENIAFIKKSRDIYQYIYMDDPTSMSQLFYYMPAATYEIDEATEYTGSALIGTSVYESDDVKMSDWLDRLESMITALLESSTLNFIYADLLNMANKVNVKTWKFDYLAENYVVMPIYNENALLQFHNLNVVGRPLTIAAGASKGWTLTTTAAGQFWITGGYNIYSAPDKNNIMFNPVFSLSGQRFAKAHIIDMPTDNPDITMRIEALRLHSAWSGAVVKATDLEENIFVNTQGDTWVTCMALPDHYPVEMFIFGNDESGNWSDTYTDDMKTLVLDYTVNSYMSDARLSAWEHRPLSYIIRNSGSAISSFSNIDVVGGGLQFYTLVDYDYIQRLLDIMYVGLFDFRV